MTHMAFFTIYLLREAIWSQPYTSCCTGIVRYCATSSRSSKPLNSHPQDTSSPGHLDPISHKQNLQPQAPSTGAVEPLTYTLGLIANLDARVGQYQGLRT